MYQVAQLKKMNTERLHKLFQKVLGYSLFNPYVERSLMIVLLNQKFNPPKEKHQTVVNVIALIDKTCEIIGKIFAAGNTEPIKPADNTRGRKPRFTWNEITSIFLMYDNGYSVKDIAEFYETSYVLVYHIIFQKAYQWAWDGSITVVDMWLRKAKEIAEQYAFGFKFAHKFYEGS